VFAEYCEVHGNYYGTHKGKLIDIQNRGKVEIFSLRFASWTSIFREDRRFIGIALIASIYSLMLPALMS
jgi:guanylate kinase